MIITVLTIIATVYETRKNNEQIRRMALYKCAVQMFTQDKELVEVSSEELVPGDIIKVP